MTLIRWQPFAEMDILRRQMDRVFDEMAQEAVNQNVWKPAIELKDTGDNLELRALVPGIEGQDLDVDVTRESVSLSGENRQEQYTEDQGLYHSEFRYGQFKRVVSLPVAIQNDKVTAKLENGVLTLILPKVEEAVNRVVKVNLT